MSWSIGRVALRVKAQDFDRALTPATMRAAQRGFQEHWNRSMVRFKAVSPARLRGVFLRNTAEAEVLEDMSGKVRQAMLLRHHLDSSSGSDGVVSSVQAQAQTQAIKASNDAIHLLSCRIQKIQNHKGIIYDARFFMPLIVSSRTRKPIDNKIHKVG